MRDTVCMNLRAIREARGMSQAHLADLVGVDQSTIARAEQMAKTAKLDTYQRCAAALGVTLSDLFCAPRSQLEDQVLQLFRSIPVEKHGDLLTVLRLIDKQG